EDENVEDVQMADHLRLMEELLQIPIVGIEDAIVVPVVLANEFELKIELLDFISNSPFFGLDNDDHHSHIKRFYQITRTFKINQVPHDVVKLILFSFSLKGAAETWLENEPPCFITSQMAEALLERPSCVPPSNTVTKPHAKLKAITTMDGLTLDGSSIPHSNLLVYQEPETITEVVEIASSQSIPLVPPLETPPLSAPKPKKNPELNPHQPLIPYPSRLQKDKFQALENPTGYADHFIYRIDIVDYLCDKFPIENNSLSGNPNLSSDHVVASLSPSPTPCGDSDFLLEETDTLLSHSNISLPSYESFLFDIDHQEEKSSGSTTSHSNHSLPEYESFCFDVDHIKEKSSGSTTSHSDLSKYESFHFDLSIDPLPPAYRSNSHHEEFADELAHIISSLEYDRFYFDIEPDPGELTRRVEENISEDSTKELTSPELNDLRFLLFDCDSIFSEIRFP
ncbi:hypothetical protein Tco_0903241, partial [Tanacetum coccineum]